MLISRAKRKTNIAEYILYMWQVEDTIRAFDFDIDRLDRELISQYDQPDEVKREMRLWYENIALHMKNENVVKSGHVRFIKNNIAELYSFHLSLLQDSAEPGYSEFYTGVLPIIREMNAKQNWTSENEVETCLKAVYIYMLMRLRKESVSPPTEEAINLFIKFLAILSSKFRACEEGK